MITTTIWSSVTEHTPQEVNYYIIDFGAETLRMFNKYPHVGEIVFQDDIGRVAGVLDLVLAEIEKRKDLFADYNGSYETYLKESGKTLPRWVIVINAFDVFSESLSRIVETVNNMFRDGIKYGISFIISTSSHNTLRTKISALFKNKIVLHMGDDSNYNYITGCDRKLIPGKEFGRGIAPVGEDTYCEFQSAYVTESGQINNIIRKNGDNFANYYKIRAKSLPKIPDSVTSAELESYATSIEEVPVGYDFNEKSIAKFDFGKEKVMLMGLDDIKNRLSSISGIVNILSKTPGVKVRVIDFTGLFTNDNVDVSLYNEDLDAVITAFEKNIRTRTIQQDQGIILILGAGLMKQKLGQFGKEMLEKFFESLSSAIKSSVILVDAYERLKILKVETWYQTINTSYGIWIGTGLENQNMFNVKALTMDERKLNFEGMAFLIDEADYTLIKTVMDGEE